MIFSFGKPQHDRIEVDVLRYERAPIGEWHDDNWLTVQIRVAAGGFRGKVDASIITAELADFLAQLRSLNETLEGSAVFTTIEEQLELTLTGDGKGQFTLSRQRPAGWRQPAFSRIRVRPISVEGVDL